MNVDAFLARAQLTLALFYGLAFVAVLCALIWILLQPGDKDAQLIAMVGSALGVFGTLATQQSSYYFARQRPNGPGATNEPTNVPDPGLSARTEPAER